MSDFSWIAPLKEGVLLLFFLTFSGLVAWVFSLSKTEEWGKIPFQDEEAA